MALYFECKSIEVVDDVADLFHIESCIEAGEVEFEDFDRLFGHHLHPHADDRQREVTGILINQRQEIGNGARCFSMFRHIVLRDEKGAVSAVDEPQRDAVGRDLVQQRRQGFDGIAVKFEEQVDREGAHHKRRRR